MKVSAGNNFVCPVDGLVLMQVDKSLCCGQGHVFDMAREGYCNLLLVQDKASRDPGDNREMVAARRRFLNTGYFAPVVKRLVAAVKEIAAALQRHEIFTVVDAGCGEGYYLDHIKESALAWDFPGELRLAGCDISKWALKAAAKRSTDIGWVVAANRRLPFAPQSVNLILSLFGYPAWTSFRELQPPHGRVVVVDTGVDHLRELREIIYPKINESKLPSIQPAIDCGYVLEREETLKFTFKLNTSSEIQDLLAMTPHAYRINEDRRRALDQLKQLSLTGDVVFRVVRV